MSWSRYVQERVEKAVSKLKPIAKAVTDYYPPVGDFFQGFTQLLAVPGFLRRSPETSALMRDSLILNIGQYVVPAVMYRRGVNLLLDRSPDWFDPVIVGMDWMAMSIFMLRLFARRTNDNLFISFNLPRTISNDNAEYLPIELARELSHEISAMFGAMFFRRKPDADFQKRFFKELQIIFKTFFLQSNINDKSFDVLTEPLSKLFQDLVESESQLEQEKTKKLCLIFAKMIPQILADAFVEQNQRLIKEERRDATQLLSEKFTRGRSIELTREFVTRIQNVRDHLKPFMPIDAVQSCRCLVTKKIQGVLETSVFALGNNLFTFTPDIINLFFVFNQQTLFALRTAFALLRFLEKGRVFDESKVGGCTRHRARTLAANRPHSYGVAAAYVLTNVMISEAIVLIADMYGLYRPSVVDDFVRKDAVLNLVSQWTSISAVGFNTPLPRNRGNEWDYFYAARLETTALIKAVNWFCIPHVPKPREELFKRIKMIISSPYLHALVEWILKGYDLYPKKLFALLNNEKVEMDTLKMIFDSAQMKQFLKLYSKDLTAALPGMYFIARTRFGSALLGSPQFLLSTFVLLPLLLLNDDSYETILKALKIKLNEIAKASQVTIVEEVPGAPAAVIAPAASHGHQVIVLEETVEGPLSESEEESEGEAFVMVPAPAETIAAPARATTTITILDAATEVYSYFDGFRNSVFNSWPMTRRNQRPQEAQGLENEEKESIELRSFN